MSLATTPRAPQKLSRAQLRKRTISRVKRSRALVQLAFAALIIIWSIRHQLEKDNPPASTDAICPFGAVETLITLLTTGEFVPKTHPSNIVLGLGLLLSIVLIGNAFCGWVCPFGALQDALTWVRTKLHLPTLAVPAGADRVLRWGRFVVLGSILYFTLTTGKLWFAQWDPYVNLFNLHWLFEPNVSTMWVAWLVLAGVLGLSLVVERAWCRYLCPAGAVFSVVGLLSVFRIRRNASACTDCTLCDKACPVGLNVMESKKAVNTNCVGCLDCVAACPVKGALNLTAGPSFLGSAIPVRDAVVTRKNLETVGAES